MNEFIYNDWLAVVTLAIQAGLLKFAYNIYKDYANKEKNRDCAIRGLLRVEIINICHNARKRRLLTNLGIRELNRYVQYL